MDGNGARGNGRAVRGIKKSRMVAQEGGSTEGNGKVSSDPAVGKEDEVDVGVLLGQFSAPFHHDLWDQSCMAPL